jgi:hypothetical protein
VRQKPIQKAHPRPGAPSVGPCARLARLAAPPVGATTTAASAATIRTSSTAHSIAMAGLSSPTLRLIIVYLIDWVFLVALGVGTLLVNQVDSKARPFSLVNPSIRGRKARPPSRSSACRWRLLPFLGEGARSNYREGRSGCLECGCFGVVARGEPGPVAHCGRCSQRLRACILFATGQDEESVLPTRFPRGRKARPPSRSSACRWRLLPFLGEGARSNYLELLGTSCPSTRPPCRC